MESNREHRGHVRDPENDGRLKENREAGRTKGTTSGSKTRAREHGREADRDDGHQRAGSEHGRSAVHGQSHSQASHDGGRRDGDRRQQADLKSREYRDEQGEVRHHTRTYVEQHGKK